MAAPNPCLTALVADPLLVHVVAVLQILSAHAQSLEALVADRLAAVNIDAQPIVSAHAQ